MKNNYKLNDFVEMKKSHACGTNKWQITRMGVEKKLKKVLGGSNE